MALSSCSEYQSSSDNLSFTAVSLRAEKRGAGLPKTTDRHVRLRNESEMDSTTPIYKVPRARFYTPLTRNQVRTPSALEVSSCPCKAQQLWQLRAKIICTLRTRLYTRSVSHVKAKQDMIGWLWRIPHWRLVFWEPQSSHKAPQQTALHVTIKHSYCDRHMFWSFSFNGILFENYCHILWIMYVDNTSPVFIKHWTVLSWLTMQ